MNLIALDTSTDYLSLAISHQGRIAHCHEPVGQKHSDLALPRLGELLGELDIALRDLDAVVFGQGPGSFTGVRIACGIAQGLAFSAGLDVIGVPTLDSVAIQAPAGDWLICLDARMGEVYHATYRVAENGIERLSPIGVGPLGTVSLPQGTWQGAGDGLADSGKAAALGLTAIRPELRPDARALLRLAQSGSYPRTAPEQAELLYVRNKVALTSREQQALRA
ncbi:tRNA (adenosine(37)-N6)-threonylcarbamoyltransferase complex dimerization subunit type 1 TsaB [Paludibacterium paludis]|uniref:tRNA (Adenosine(37)-N6)-threonylcarbamoyltransferase complex dimerization subunit type 1 TsaB n=1 Tax=Paludibacterium paludis TaxID=1225769 RepID=A0A918P4F7_9NEIS|nr:tRNA (adenosine(37)-N6)-threonylcarbamoyltransferase complex dimerization subunit type 1 TsaB [Paludibacterium paludis]GGY21967.1 tRNA (adenosine(37)-N6)-threonylcarbamoyltransferase complex dimerization subunit type 1 TsaB [Paludibacterium paludis]